MSIRRKCLLGLFAIFLISGCYDLPTPPESPVAPQPSMGLPAWGGDGVKVMSRNLYPGADVAPIIVFQPDPGDTPAENFAAFAAVVNGVWQQAKAADFRIRAERLAWEIATHGPHAVGLQEATTFIEILQGPGGPLVTELDFLSVLLEALADRGAAYSLAALNIDLDVTLPIDVVGSAIRYIDMDAVIVRHDVEVLSSISDNYPPAVTVTVPTFAGPLALLRGWNRLDIVANDQRVHFVNTHLEPDEISLAAQAGQAAFLATMLASEDDPMILVGDLNADPDQTASPNAYEVFQAFGYADGWPMAGPQGHAVGYTCCHDPDLQNLLPDLFERIDYVMLGPSFPVGRSQGWLVGDRPSSANPAGLWPSDHAGVVVKLEVTPPALAAQ